MNADDTARPRPTRRLPWLLIGAALLLVLALVAVRMALQADRVSALVLRRAGHALGLEITAGGPNAYRLRGTPQLVLRDLQAREPGSDTPVLRARRLSIALPWSTLRAGGSELVAKRLELDGPVLDLPALRHWLATRPPSEKRMPTLADGLAITDGTVIGGTGAGGWRIDHLDIRFPALARGQPVHARLHGRLLAPPMTVQADLAATVARPAALFETGTTGAAMAGQMTVVHDHDWRVPATVSLSGPLAIGKDAVVVAPMRLGAAADYRSGATRLPFALGAHGPLRLGGGAVRMAPATVVLRGTGPEPASDPVPDLQAHGSITLGQRLALDLEGRLARWPAAWPALPAPLDASTDALPFAVDYAGPADLSQVAGLRLRRGPTRFDGRFRLREITDWIARDADAKSPLPPLDGRLRTPRLEIAGAQLDGVDIRIDDPAVDGAD